MPSPRALIFVHSSLCDKLKMLIENAYATIELLQLSTSNNERLKIRWMQQNVHRYAAIRLQYYVLHLTVQNEWILNSCSWRPCYSPSGGQPNVLRRSPQGRAWRSSWRRFLSIGVSDCAQPITDIEVFGNFVSRPLIDCCLLASSSAARGASRSNGFIGGWWGLDGVLHPVKLSSSCHRRYTANKHYI